MTCAKKAFLVLSFTIMLGLWGCSQSTPQNSGSARLRELEARNTRLEDDFKTACAARDEARKKITALEEQRAKLAQQVEELERVVKERDEFREQAAVRAAERDAVQAQLVQFGHELQNLVQKMEQAATNHHKPPVTSVAAPAAPGGTKS